MLHSPELTTVSSEAKIIYQSLIFASSRFSFFRLLCTSIIRSETTKILADPPARLVAL
ncbi:hypothetical protein CBM2633_A70419 [Cupriavidus taiwanensis]|uniref:Uncharacterized protein n=1 Tax=Cupriavidus taiwanensis TaxID=164546 RepID=A0A375DZ96_9BURK|nr:hypothetical protein CBM2604_A90024 [Cupriavidus taiwanensis]SOZ23420.1 hypothetical protein CBM2609_A110025 [Cupriavidus taiwanensis]SOZ43838.1 hypothetical protein CBM2610_A110024 [Cupriavidus taiwanensis]SOZ52752.1 hypothetical protein CBM2615_A240343 [Cupriavidus taiwanensis]SOZ54255.1 hypothetical protein CBM2614_A210345 [Cupriavidus taiwanensis]